MSTAPVSNLAVMPAAKERVRKVLGAHDKIQDSLSQVDQQRQKAKEDYITQRLDQGFDAAQVASAFSTFQRQNQTFDEQVTALKATDEMITAYQDGLAKSDKEALIQVLEEEIAKIKTDEARKSDLQAKLDALRQPPQQPQPPQYPGPKSKPQSQTAA